MDNSYNNAYNNVSFKVKYLKYDDLNISYIRMRTSRNDSIFDDGLIRIAESNGFEHGVNVLSLFDGMSCGMIALKKAGIAVNRYVAIEIDKFASQASSHNFPMIERGRDVFETDFTQYEGFDFLIGGSPCTFWSRAKAISGKREDTPDGEGYKLFSKYLEALHTVKPKFFIYENNASMSKDVRDKIREDFGFEEMMIDSSLVSAQGRKRFYWVGVRNGNGYAKADIPMPEDRNVSVSDIIEDGWFPVNIKYGNKAGTLRASDFRRAERDFIGNDTDRRTCACKFAFPLEAIDTIGNEALSTEKFDTDGYGNRKVFPVINGIVRFKDKRYPVPVKKDGFYFFRPLTVRESAKLQTVPDWYEFPTSKSQSLKMIGNGWTIDVISFIMRTLIERYL